MGRMWGLLFQLEHGSTGQTENSNCIGRVCLNIIDRTSIPLDPRELV